MRTHDLVLVCRRPSKAQVSQYGREAMNTPVVLVLRVWLLVVHFIRAVTRIGLLEDLF